MSFEAVSVYVSDLMKRLITDPRYRRGPDGKCHHYDVPCSHLEVYVNWYVPQFFAKDITQQLITHVNMCYTELIDDRFQKKPAKK
jgi:hypothetical protein